MLSAVHRRHSKFRFVPRVVLLVASGVSAMGACSTFGSDGEGATTDGGPDVAVVAVEASTVPGCPPRAFCDSFDDRDDARLTGQWTSKSQSGLGKINILPEAGLDGSGGLVTVATGGSGTQSAFLRLNRGPTPANFRFTLAFAAKVVAATGFYLGPRFTSAAVGGLRRDVIVDFENGKTRFDLFNEGCDAGAACPTLGNGQWPVDDKWHRYKLEGVVHPPSNGDSGNVTLELDGLNVLAAKLTIPLANAISHGLDFGLTYGSTNVSGTVTYDDVVFELTEL